MSISEILPYVMLGANLTLMVLFFRKDKNKDKSDDQEYIVDTNDLIDKTRRRISFLSSCLSEDSNIKILLDHEKNIHSILTETMMDINECKPQQYQLVVGLCSHINRNSNDKFLSVGMWNGSELEIKQYSDNTVYKANLIQWMPCPFEDL